MSDITKVASEDCDTNVYFVTGWKLQEGSFKIIRYSVLCKESYKEILHEEHDEDWN